MDDLEGQDHANIVAMTRDPKFESMLKLHDNLKSRYLKTIAFKKDPEKEDIYRGAAMAIVAIKAAMKGELETASAEMKEEAAKQKGLDMVGW